MAIKNSHLLKKDKPTIPQLTYGNIETPIVNERETDARTPNGTVHYFCETKNTISVAQIKENKTNHFWNSLEKAFFYFISNQVILSWTRHLENFSHKTRFYRLIAAIQRPIWCRFAASIDKAEDYYPKSAGNHYHSINSNSNANAMVVSLSQAAIHNQFHC